MIRQVNNKVDLEGKNSDGSGGISFSKLLSVASTVEKTKIFFGWSFAAITGAVLPWFFFFIGPVFDEFKEPMPGESMQELADRANDKVRELCIMMGILSLGIAFTSFWQNYLLMTAASSLGARLKTTYLRKVLNMESAWYEQTGYLELASRMTREVETITQGIGQKTG